MVFYQFYYVLIDANLNKFEVDLLYHFRLVFTHIPSGRLIIIARSLFCFEQKFY